MYIVHDQMIIFFNLISDYVHGFIHDEKVKIHTTLTRVMDLGRTLLLLPARS